MLTIRCNETEKESVLSIIRELKPNSKKRTIEIIIDALQVYKEYKRRVNDKIDKASIEVWSEL